MPPPESHRGIPIVDPATLAGPRDGATGTTPGTSLSEASVLLGTVTNAAPHEGGDTSTCSQGNSVLCNLLPSLYSAKDSSSMAGIYVGEGLPSVPAKLVDKIRHWEFVEMNELLPEVLVLAVKEARK